MGSLAGGRGGDYIADLDFAIGDDHAVNQQLHQLSLPLERGARQPLLHPVAELFHRGGQDRDFRLPVHLGFQLPLLLG
jgi:hypothetical protein